MKSASKLVQAIWRGVLVLAVFVGALDAGWLLKRRAMTGKVDTLTNALPSPQTVGHSRPAGLLKTNVPLRNPPPSFPDSPDRVADARTRHGGTIAARFAAVGVRYPPGEIFLRALKHEGELELWARDSGTNKQPFRLVNTYPILAASGRLGPKRREGDLQVPEGFYTIDRFNPRSLFHLSLGLNYPNASDRILTTDPAAPGSDVFIHGGCVSAGCLALGDPVIEEIFLAASDAKHAGQEVIRVQIFPCRLNADNWSRLLTPICSGDDRLQTFWQSLQKAYDYFERAHLLLPVEIAADGSYTYPTSASE